MPYNGELRELYNDLDKRIAVDAAERISWRDAFEARLVAMFSNMPCSAHANELKWLTKSIWVLASISAFVGLSIITFMVKVHLG